MALSKKQINTVEGVLRVALRKRFAKYKPEPAAMPFHTRLLGKDRMALYSFIHSLSTNFGTSIFEPVAVALANNSFENVKSQVSIGKNISEFSQIEIQRIMDGLTTARTDPDKISEIEAIRKVAQKGKMIVVKPTKVDIFMQDGKGGYFLFDLKTAKPNKGGFKEFKRTLLEWVAIVLADNPSAEISTFIAIPYNPYEPKPYTRWTMRGMIDLKNELKVAEEFWNFLASQDVYQGLLDCFERVGIEMQKEIDDYFKKYNH